MYVRALLCFALILPAGARIQDPAPVPRPAPAVEEVPTREAAQAFLDAGDMAGAERAFRARFAADATDGEAAFLLGYALHSNGKLQEAHDMHLEATAFPEYAALANYNHACVHALWYQPAQAFQALDVAVERGFSDLDQLNNDSDMNNLRSDPRFAKLIAKLQNPSPAEAAAPTPKPAAPNLQELPNAKRFDFLLGDYTVAGSAEGQAESLCTGSTTFDGTAIRTVVTDAATGKQRAATTYIPIETGWRMLWMSPKGDHAVLEGGLVGSEMILGVVSLNGEPRPNSRAVFSSVGAQGFRYSWQERGDDGEWSVQSTWRYARRSDSAAQK